MTESATTSATASHTARALVTTGSAARYAKQLASHFRHKAEVHAEAEGSRIVLSVGSCLLVAGDHVVELRARSDSSGGLERVQKVIGSHLERFGQRDGLTVDWCRGA